MELPCSICNGRCCTYPALTKIEFKKLERKYGLPIGTKLQKMEQVISYNPELPSGDTAYVVSLKNGNCPWLSQGKCLVYKDRPSVCRMYGVVEEMPCQFLYPQLAEQKTQEALRKSREQ